MSDTFRGNPPDVRWLSVGAGLSQTFKCARCAGSKGILGRRKQRVRGVPQWVCKGCVLPGEEVRAAT